MELSEAVQVRVLWPAAIQFQASKLPDPLNTSPLCHAGAFFSLVVIALMLSMEMESGPLGTCWRAVRIPLMMRWRIVQVEQWQYSAASATVSH